MAQVMMTLRLSTFLSGKSWLRQTADAKSRHAKQASGKVLRFRFLRKQLMNGRMLHARHRRDVELVKTIAAEHDARDVSNRHPDAAIDRAVRRVADEVPGNELCVPDESFL